MPEMEVVLRDGTEIANLLFKLWVQLSEDQHHDEYTKIDPNENRGNLGWSFAGSVCSEWYKHGRIVRSSASIVCLRR